MPWKIQGYCETIAGEPSVDPEEGFRRVADGSIDVPGGHRYFRDQFMVRYLLDVEVLTVDQLFARSFDEEVVMGRERAHLDELRAMMKRIRTGSSLGRTAPRLGDQAGVMLE